MMSGGEAMSRGDRLVKLIQILKDGRLHRAEDMASDLRVSPRTVYRDMDTLADSGIPVEGTRGIGYQITADFTLPPLNLTKVELEALHIGLAVVGQAPDEELSNAAAALSAKIDAVLPEDRQAAPTGFGFAIYPFADVTFGFQHMPSLRAAIRARQKVEVTSQSGEEEATTRIIRPLQLDYWGRVWMLVAWCETIADFEQFRVDRIENLRMLPAIFLDEDGKRLEDYLSRKL